MRLERWNGERWYVDDRAIWRRVLTWFVWFGGLSASRRLRRGILTPTSLFGHRITFFAWGTQVRTRNGYWVWTRYARQERRIYWSPDGTPSGATIWVTKRPKHV